MRLRKWTERMFFLAVVLVALTLILGSVLGQPLLLSYVKTDSMSPTLEPGDGFIAVPAQIDSSTRDGEIIVFRAEELHGGGLTTHRVVRETERGFITKGDSNPFTDQKNGEPPVRRSQITASVLQIGGDVVVIPHLGTAVEGAQSVFSTSQRRLTTFTGLSVFSGSRGLAYLFFVGALVWYIAGALRESGGKSRTRDRSRRGGIDARVLMAVFATVLITGATMAMVLPAGTQQYGVVSAEFDSERPNVVPMGESSAQRYAIGNGGFLPVVTYLEPASEGVDVDPREFYVEGNSVANATVTLHAPPQTGYYRRFVVEHRYLAVLPQPVIRGLYRVHPWAPIVSIDALIAVPFYLVGITLAGGGRIRNQSRDSRRSIPDRIRRLLRP